MEREARRDYCPRPGRCVLPRDRRRVFVAVQNSQNYGTELFALSASTGSVDWSVGLGGLYCFSALTYDGWRLFALNYRDHGFRTGKPDPNPMQDVDFTKARFRGLEFRRLNLHSVSFERPGALLVEGHNRPGLRLILQDGRRQVLNVPAGRKFVPPATDRAARRIYMVGPRWWHGSGRGADRSGGAQR